MRRVIANNKFTERVMFTATEASVSTLRAGTPRSERIQAERQRPMTILLVDAHFLIRESLRDCLKQLKSEATILEAANGQQAMQLVSEHADIRLVLLELNLPDRDGFSLLGELRERHPTISVVVLSARQDRDSVARALDLGAIGFIPKSELREVTLSALDLVLAGGVYIPPEILLRDQRPLTSAKLACSSTRPVKPEDLGLTIRQTDVLGLMMQGK